MQADIMSTEEIKVLENLIVGMPEVLIKGIDGNWAEQPLTARGLRIQHEIGSSIWQKVDFCVCAWFINTPAECSVALRLPNWDEIKIRVLHNVKIEQISENLFEFTWINEKTSEMPPARHFTHYGDTVPR